MQAIEMDDNVIIVVCMRDRPKEEPAGNTLEKSNLVNWVKAIHSPSFAGQKETEAFTFGAQQGLTSLDWYKP